MPRKPDPVFDGHLTKIQNAKTELALREDVAVAVGKDGALSTPQKMELMDIIRQNIEFINANGAKAVPTSGEEPAGGGEGRGQALSEGALLRSPNSSVSQEAGNQLLTPQPAGEPVLLEPSKFRDPLMPVTTGAALKKAFEAWRKTAEELIDRTPTPGHPRGPDISVIHEQEYFNITFWRKVAVAYGIEAWPKKRVLVIRDGVLVAEVEMTVRAPNGRTAQSFGIASKAELKLKAASDHDLQARAWSRAYVRGLRDLVGFGAPSAEEAEEGEEQ